MTQQAANRLLAVVLLIAQLALVPGIASRLAVQGSVLPSPPAAALLTALAVCVVATGLSALRGTSPRGPARLFVAVGLVLVVLRTWLLWDVTEPIDYRAWASLVVPVVVGACALALTGWRAVLLVVGVCAGYAVVRTHPAWEGLGVLESVQEGAFLVGLGVTAVVAVAALQVAADQVTAAEEEAVAAHRRAEGATAAARESARWDALIHDDVLSALATAVHAEGPVMARRAAAEADRALRRIDELATDGPESPEVLAGRLADAVRSVDADAVLHVELAPDARPLPREVADAVLDAATEAVRNAVRHGGRGALVQVHGRLGPDGVALSVRDDGRGFVPDDVDPGRLGLRLSVRGRVEAVGGSASWQSEPGRGTRVDLAWPR